MGRAGLLGRAPSPHHGLGLAHGPARRTIRTMRARPDRCFGRPASRGFGVGRVHSSFGGLLRHVPDGAMSLGEERPRHPQPRFLVGCRHGTAGPRHSSLSEGQHHHNASHRHSRHVLPTYLLVQDSATPRFYRGIFCLWFHSVLGRLWLVPGTLQLTQHYKTKARTAARHGNSAAM